MKYQDNELLFVSWINPHVSLHARVDNDIYNPCTFVTLWLVYLQLVVYSIL
jgi:hypothetical protein